MDIIRYLRFKWQSGTVIILPLLNLLMKLALINCNQAEYTDSIFYMSIDKIGKTKWLPVYPILIQLSNIIVKDITISGKIVAILMNTLCLFPLYSISKRLYGHKAAVITLTLFIVSPLITIFSIRVMAESTFAFFLLMSIWCLLQWIDKRRAEFGAGLIGFSGIAALTRPEGVGLLPIAFIFMLYVFIETRPRGFAWIAIGWVPWLFQIIWHWWIVGRYGYGRELGFSIKTTAQISKILSYMLLYLIYIPYIFSPFIFLATLNGFYRSIRSESNDAVRKVFNFFIVYFFLVWILFLSLHWAWSTRFIFPIICLSLIFSGYGIITLRSRRLRISLFLICIITGLGFTALGLINSMESFGDIKRAAIFIRNNVNSNVEVLSTELVKTEFWSGRQVHEYKREKIHSGVVVVLHNMNYDLEMEMKYIRENYNIKVLYQTTATIVPILAAGIYLEPTKRKDGTIAWIGKANHPISLYTQFSKQRFKSVVLEIEKGSSG